MPSSQLLKLMGKFAQVFDVLENQGRSALLPDAVISNILGQLNVTVSYAPLMCTKVHLVLPDAVTMGGYLVFGLAKFQ
ncbi:hypothetical protein KIN20_034290 [Parelaphostrongylus tenuis]|uniref:Uncharacterized protein n=1 Tax=Parelaphostrongylus tenuis TaxID=148309 RepID=A0AAD5R9H9_PARTN|nr:hypothetical protein KIN20_034290 [Parelaphostrongylus tenuis]